MNRRLAPISTQPITGRRVVVRVGAVSFDGMGGGYPHADEDRVHPGEGSA